MDFEVLIFYFACNTQILRHWEGGAKTVGVFLAVRKQYVSINSNRSDILLANECFFYKGESWDYSTLVFCVILICICTLVILLPST